MKSSEDKLCIGTAFYVTSGSAVNLKVNSEAEKLAVYYQCMVVFFTSMKCFYNKNDFVLFTNVTPPNKYTIELNRLGVEIKLLDSVDVKITNNTLLSNHFPGCLFTLDVLSYFETSNMFDKYRGLWLLDSDCIANNYDIALVTQLDKESNNSISCYEIDYGEDYLVNGQSRSSLTELSREIFGVNETLIPYYGGEFYYINSDMSHKLNKKIDLAIEHIIRNGGGTFTEEHILTIVFTQFKNNLFSSESSVKRVWTTYSHWNLNENDFNVSLLHLPAEKGRIFSELYSMISDSQNSLYDVNYGELALSKLLVRRNSLKYKFKRSLAKIKNILRVR